MGNNTSTEAQSNAENPEINLRATADSVGGNDFADSLASYLQQIGKMPPLPPEQQQQLGDDIDAVTRKLRHQIHAFGFVTQEHLRLLNECISTNSDPADYFQPSSLKKEDISAGELLKLLMEWKGELHAKHTALAAAFRAVTGMPNGGPNWSNRFPNSTYPAICSANFSRSCSITPG